MKLSRLLLTLFVSVVLLGAVARGQERQNGLFLTSPLSLSAGYDQGFVANARTFDDSVTILTTPVLSWIKSTHRSHFVADYQGEIELFSHEQDLNSWNHDAALRYSYTINSRLSFDAGDAFLSTSDASRQLAQSQLLLPLGRYRQNSFFSGLNYRLNARTKFNVRLDHAYTTMALTGPRASGFNQMAYAATFTVDHTLSRHHAVTGSYAYLRSRPIDDGGTPGSSHQALNSVNAGYIYTPNRGLLFRVSGGAVHGQELSYTAGAVVEKQVGRVWLMAGYQRYLSFTGGLATGTAARVDTPGFANGLLPNSILQVLSFRVRGKLTRRIGIELNGQRGRANLGDQGFRSLIGQSRLDYRLNDRLIVFIRAEYYGQNASQFADSSLARRRYLGGLEIVLARRPEPAQMERDRGRAPGGPPVADAPEPEKN